MSMAAAAVVAVAAAAAVAAVVAVAAAVAVAVVFSEGSLTEPTDTIPLDHARWQRAARRLERVAVERGGYCIEVRVTEDFLLFLCLFVLR